MAEREVEYSPARGVGTLEAFAELEDSPLLAIQTQGLNFRDALLGAMINAELMAGAAGVIPMVELPDGQRGVVEVGRARRVLGNPDEWFSDPQADPKDVEVVYLAVWGACRNAGAFARNPTAGVPVIEPSKTVPAGTPAPALFRPVDFGLPAPPPTAPLVLTNQPVLLPALPPLVIALIVLGLAATVATAWYATSTKNVESDVDRATNVSATSQLAAIAAQQIAQGKDVDPEIIEAMRALGNREKQGSWLVPVAAGVLGLGIGAAAVTGIIFSQKNAA